MSMQVTLDAPDFNELRHDAARWRYVRDNLAQASGPKMGGNWTWRFRFPGGSTARTIDELIDRMIAELGQQRGDGEDDGQDDQTQKPS